VRERIAGGVGVVLHGDGGDLTLADPVTRHERARDERGQRRHRGAVRPLVGIDGAPDQLGDPRRGDVGHLLAADHEHGRAQPARHLGEAGVERGRPRRCGRLDAKRGNVGESHVAGDVGGEVAVAHEFLGIHRRDHDGLRALEAGHGERRQGGLGHQLGQRLAASADTRHTGATDPDVLHRRLL